MERRSKAGAATTAASRPSRPRRGARARRREATPVGRLAPRLPRGARTCATRSSPPACSPTRSRPRSPGTASPEFHARVMDGAAGDRRGLRRGAGRPGSPRLSCRFTHVYPDGPAPYYTVLAPGEARRRGRAVGRGQGGGLGDGDRRRRHDHPPPRRRPRPPALVRPPAARSVRRGAPAPQSGRRPAGVLNPGVLVDP